VRKRRPPASFAALKSVGGGGGGERCLEQDDCDRNTSEGNMMDQNGSDILLNAGEGCRTVG
jgi:hypothetical protein